MKLDVAVEEPIAGIGGLESDDSITTIWNSDCVLDGWIVQIPFE